MRSDTVISRSRTRAAAGCCTRARQSHRIGNPWILLSFENDPSGVVAQLTEHPLKGDTAITGNSEHALEHRAQEAPVLGPRSLAHDGTDILGVHVPYL